MLLKETGYTCRKAINYITKMNWIMVGVLNMMWVGVAAC